MIASLLVFGLAAAGAQSDPAPTPFADLFGVFKAVCMRDGKFLGVPNSAAFPAGFEPVSVAPFEGNADAAHEVAAWQRNGIRISEVSAQTDARWRLLPSCAVQARVGRIRNEDALTKEIDRALDPIFIEGSGGGRWNIVTGSGLVQLFVNSTDPARPVVTIYADAGLPEKTP